MPVFKLFRYIVPFYELSLKVPVVIPHTTEEAHAVTAVIDLMIDSM